MKLDTLDRNIGRAYRAWLGEPTKKMRAPLQAALLAYYESASCTEPSLKSSAPPPTSSDTTKPTSMGKPTSRARSRGNSRAFTPAMSSEPCDPGTSPADPLATSALARLAEQSTGR